MTVVTEEIKGGLKFQAEQRLSDYNDRLKHTHGSEQNAATNFYSKDADSYQEECRFDQLWLIHQGLDTRKPKGMDHEKSNHVDWSEKDNALFVRSIASTAELSYDATEQTVELIKKFDGRKVNYLGGDIAECLRYAVVEVICSYSPYKIIDAFREEVDMRVGEQKFREVCEVLRESEEYDQIRLFK